MPRNLSPEEERLVEIIRQRFLQTADLQNEPPELKPIVDQVNEENTPIRVSPRTVSARAQSQGWRTAWMRRLNARLEIESETPTEDDRAPLIGDDEIARGVASLFSSMGEGDSPRSPADVLRAERMLDAIRRAERLHEDGLPALLESTLRDTLVLNSAIIFSFKDNPERLARMDAGTLIRLQGQALDIVKEVGRLSDLQRKVKEKEAKTEAEQGHAELIDIQNMLKAFDLADGSNALLLRNREDGLQNTN